MGNSGIEVPITKKLYQILCRIGHRRIFLRLASQDLHVHWPFKSDTSGKVSNLELLFSSRSLRTKIINLDLVSMPEIEGDFFSISSRSLRLSVKKVSSRLDVRDWIGEILILVSKLKKSLSLTSGLSGWDGHGCQSCVLLRVSRLVTAQSVCFGWWGGRES